MHKLVVSLLVVSSCFFAPVSAKDVLVSSPDGAVTVVVGVKANRPYYTVSSQGQTVISPSHLGFELSDGFLGENVKILQYRTT